MLETSTRLKPSWHGDSEGLSASRLTFQSIHLNNPSVQSQAGKDRSSSRNQKKSISCSGLTNTQDAESQKSCQRPLLCFRMELKVSQQAEKLCDTWTRETEPAHTLTYFSLDNCSVHFQCWGKIQTPKGKRKKRERTTVFLYCAFPEKLFFFLFWRVNFAIWMQMWVSSREGKKTVLGWASIASPLHQQGKWGKQLLGN